LQTRVYLKIVEPTTTLLQLIAKNIGKVNGWDVYDVSSIIGDTIQTIEYSDFSECEVACAERDDCVAFVAWGSWACELKSSAERDGMRHIYVKRNEWTVVKDADIDGYDTQQISYSDLSKCREACDEDADCVAFVDIPSTKQCSLKSTAVIEPSLGKNVYVTGREQGWWSQWSQGWEQHESSTVLGPTLETIEYSSLSQCLEACAKRVDCVAVMDIESDQVCKLKSFAVMVDRDGKGVYLKSGTQVWELHESSAVQGPSLETISYSSVSQCLEACSKRDDCVTIVDIELDQVCKLKSSGALVTRTGKQVFKKSDSH